MWRISIALTLLKGDNNVVMCVASLTEWRESYLFTGGDHFCIIQLFSKYALLEYGPKLVYLNTSTRGYSKGLRAGKDPKKPLVAIDEHFEKNYFKSLNNIVHPVGMKLRRPVSRRNTARNQKVAGKGDGKTTKS